MQNQRADNRKKLQSIDFFLRIIIFCYIIWRDIIKDNIVLYCDLSLQDMVDFSVSQTDAASYFVRKFLVEKLLSALPKSLQARVFIANFV